MKLMIVVCLVAMVRLSLGTSEPSKPPIFPDRCVVFNEICVRGCQEGSHPYFTPGCGPVKPAATCDDPNPVGSGVTICDYSVCYCNPPTVRDTTTNKCVPLEECPKKEETEKKD